MSFMVSAADGTVLGCLATPLLCSYLAERGRISEAWKLVGYAIRNAEAVGMHFDPDWKLWQMMSGDEKLLRRRALWGLFIADKTYAYILGRTNVLRRATCAVALFPTENSDGSRNWFNAGQNAIISLMELVAEGAQRVLLCVGATYPGCQNALDMDRKFEEWKRHLEAEYQPGYDLRSIGDLSPSEVRLIACQRYLLHTWYLNGRLKLFISSTTGQERLLQPPHLLRENMEKCLCLAFQVIRFQIATFHTIDHSHVDTIGPIYPGGCWLFEGCFSLFEASVALFTGLAQYPIQEKMLEAKSAIESAVAVFGAVARREEGKKRETAARATELLTTILHQHWSEASQSFQATKIKGEPDDAEDLEGSRVMPDLQQFISPALSCMRDSDNVRSAEFPAGRGGYNR
ncbi:hypothetical protein NLJ89_g5975 [Agrocybe chaxingu]|uniref:Xylanolytic transcriptional activator regulatory domain-containing protein n=1 Tax=Agrocybe chaxingu TaxID=84603 RepID=A0A9W8K024_9AGAR|nr:hypothetical protein NLJ89_g5975 [Agrocybe chaxingu]